MAAAADREGEPDRALFAASPRRLRVMFIPTHARPGAAPSGRLRGVGASGFPAVWGGALVRGAGGSRARFTTGFGISLTIFFGFGFAFGGVIKPPRVFVPEAALEPPLFAAVRPPRAPPASFADPG